MTLSFRASLNRERIMFFHTIIEEWGYFHVASCDQSHWILCTRREHIYHSVCYFQLLANIFWLQDCVNQALVISRHQYQLLMRIITIFQSIQRSIWPLMTFFIALSYTPIYKIPDQLLQAFHNNLLLFALCWKRVIDLALQIPFAFLLNLIVKAYVFEA